MSVVLADGERTVQGARFPYRKCTRKLLNTRNLCTVTCKRSDDAQTRRVMVGIQVSWIGGYRDGSQTVTFPMCVKKKLYLSQRPLSKQPNDRAIFLALSAKCFRAPLRLICCQLSVCISAAGRYMMQRCISVPALHSKKVWNRQGIAPSKERA